MPVIAISSENELVAQLDAVTDADKTWYRRIYGLNIPVSIWPVGGGGVYYLDGFRTDNNYEWQRAISYGHTIRHFMRSKTNGIWSKWIDCGFSHVEFTDQFEQLPYIKINKAYVKNRVVFIMGHLPPSAPGVYKMLIPQRYRPLYNMAGAHYVSNSNDVGCVSAVYIESASTIAVWTNQSNIANITFSFLYPI